MINFISDVIFVLGTLIRYNIASIFFLYIYFSFFFILIFVWFFFLIVVRTQHRIYSQQIFKCTIYYCQLQALCRRVNL